MNKLAIEIRFSSLIKFAMPSIIMMVIMSLYTMVDGMFVANLIGTKAFSAISIILPMLSLIVAIGSMIGSGICAIISKKLGEGRQQEANENVTFIILFTLLLGFSITVLCLLFLEPMIRLLGADDSVYQFCADYALPLLFFIPASLLQLIFQTLFVANGKPNVGLIVTILGGVSNIILDYVFIALFDMGISGAAIATGIGYTIPSLYGLYYFSKHQHGNFHFVRPKVDWQVLLHTLGNGSSEMVSNLSGSITTFLFNIIMMHYVGADGVAAIAIILYLDFLLIAISLGYAMGIAPITSYNYGAQNYHRLQKIFQISIRFCIYIGLIMTATTFLFASPLVSLFISKGTSVHELARIGLQIYCFSYLAKGFNIFSSSLFTSLSNGRISAFLSLMRSLVFLVTFLLGLSYLFGVEGIWFAPILSEGCALLLGAYMVIKYKHVYQY